MINLMKPPLELQRGFKDEKHLKKVRELPCLVCKKDKQISPTEAHHFWGCGAGKTSSDLLSFPLCNFHHTGSFDGHVVGQSIHYGLKEFEKNYGTQKELIALTYEKLGLSEKWVSIKEYIK